MMQRTLHQLVTGVHQSEIGKIIPGLTNTVMCHVQRNAFVVSLGNFAFSLIGWKPVPLVDIIDGN
ncbi:hypothetical protein E2542_SST01750 [Spatholobus suberectus]|nr:hypothetical protein E2542_SST01750 [Spatholobus suberectus]